MPTVDRPRAAATASPAPRGERFRAWLLRQHPVAVVVVATLVSIAISDAIVIAVLLSIGDDLDVGLPVATMFAAVFAPVITGLMLRMVRSLEQVRGQIARIATTDELTGLYNRRFLLEMAERELHLAARYDTPVAVILLDVDHFKAVNDTYGHQCGDLVLQAIADTARQSLRGADVVARFGGEEFLVLLPHTTLGGALVIADRIRQTVATMPVHWAGQRITITVSLGVSALSSTYPTMDALIHGADLALYEAKGSGRNQVCAAPLTVGTAATVATATSAGRAIHPADGAPSSASMAARSERPTSAAPATRPAGTSSTPPRPDRGRLLEAAGDDDGLARSRAARFRLWLLAQPPVRTVLAIVLVVVVISNTVTLALLLAIGDPLAVGLTLSTVCAGTMTAAIAGLLLTVGRQLEDARRQISRVAVTDELTGLFNRRFFLQMAERELAQATRHATPLSVVLLDVDHFKAVNDTHGHQCGDLVLQSLAHASQNLLRGTDVLARFGGEELVVLLPHTDLAGAVEIAERLRLEVAGTIVRWEGRPVPVTISLGVSALSAAATTVDALIHAADLALYQAKDAGRNLVRAGDGAVLEQAPRVLAHDVAP